MIEAPEALEWQVSGEAGLSRGSKAIRVLLVRTARIRLTDGGA